jgi:hypothetical protein
MKIKEKEAVEKRPSVPTCRDSPPPSSLRRTYKCDSLLRLSGALHLTIFEQPRMNSMELLTIQVVKMS